MSHESLDFFRTVLCVFVNSYCGVFCSSLQESTAVISGYEKEQKTAFKEK